MGVGPPLRRGRVAASWRTLGAVVSILVVATGCLGPTDPDPTGRNPFGVLESIVVDGDGVRVVGWAIDPSTTNSVTVTAWRDGRRVDARADRPRADVAAAHPRYGRWHGFDFRVPDLTAGPHTVCISVDNVGAGEHTRVLGCADLLVGRDPHGRFETLTTDADGRLRLAGWARDPDATGPVPVGVVLDGARLATVSAEHPPGGAAVAGAGGFVLDVALPPGRREVCLVLGNRGRGSDQWLGCRSVTVPSRPSPVPAAALSRVEPTSPSSLVVQGLAGGPTSGEVIEVRAELSGPALVRALTTTTGPDGAFELVAAELPPGPVQVCVVVTGPSGERTLPCGSAVLGEVGVGTTGTPSGAAAAVAPPDGHPLRGADRDGGVSVELADGSILWLFGDTLERDRSGADRYFVNNTAAWASATAPTVPRDGSAVGGTPEPFVTPLPGTADRFACPPSMPAPVMWPMSAVAVPADDGGERVLAFFANICLGGPDSFDDRGVALVEWTYDASDPPVDRVMRGTVLEQFLFEVDEPQYGSASLLELVDGELLLHTYDCGSPAAPDPPRVQFPNEWGRCTAARVPPNSVADLAAWQWWDGAGWSADPAQAVTMDGIPDPSPATDSKAPVAAFNLVREPSGGWYVMAYNPWPGYTAEVNLRVSRTPVGPWTEPVTVRMPDCDERIGPDRYYCYAGAVHGFLSGHERLGVGYYDQLVAVAPPKGAYLATDVSFVVRDFSS